MTKVEVTNTWVGFFDPSSVETETLEFRWRLVAKLYVSFVNLTPTFARAFGVYLLHAEIVE